jgi:hypothetical protein
VSTKSHLTFIISKAVLPQQAKRNRPCNYNKPMCKKTLLSLAAVILAGLNASVTNAAFTPVAIQSSSYNADVIVEQAARPRLALLTDATVDNGTKNTASTWYEIGFDTANPSFGLPAAGSTFTAQDNANYSFKMPPSYSAPNGILIDTVVTSGTFTLVTPAAYNLLSFMGSGGNGGDVINVRVNHQDGTFETGSFGCPDWFGGSGIAYTAQGRIDSAYRMDVQVNGANPRIYFRDVTLANTTSPVTNIVLTYASGSAGSHNDILGVSGATTPGGAVTPINVTGYTYDFIVEASGDKRGRVMSQTIVDGTNVWATSQSLDNTSNGGNSWYEQGYNTNNAATDAGTSPNNNLTGTGLPHPGTFVTNGAGDHIYQMPADYTVNNSIYISSDPSFTNATITLTAPAAYTGLSFLASAGNGPVVVQAVVHHQDSSVETIDLSIADWFNASPAVITANGRVDVGNAQLNNVNGNNPRLIQNDIVLANTTSPVTSIELVNTNATSGRFAMLALSAAAGALPPVIAPQPVGVNAYEGTSVSFVSGATANVPITYQWQKGTNGVYANLVNGGNISGVTTTTLNVGTIGFADEADYRMVATDAAGSVPSSAAKLGVLSSATDVTTAGDPITSFGIGHWGDGGVNNAIDNNLGAKIGGGVSGPCGVVVSPSMGATLVNALRVYTANDSEDRDPTDYKLEGSTDGGGTYTLIASNALALPAGRNNSGAPDPLTQFVQEVRFPNANGYSSYRLTFSHYKGGAGQGAFQAGEIELLGVATNMLSAVVPPVAKAFQGTALTVTATVVGTPTPTTRWQKQIGSIFTDLTDGGTVSGSHTATLTINPADYSDTGLFRAIVSNTSGSATSGVAQVTILSASVDVTVPFTDLVVDFGNTSTTPASTDGAINENFTSFVTRGSGLNNNAGFPPFAGPVGIVITPSVGSTVITAVRLYPGSEGSTQDPADLKLEGSSNGGGSYTTLIPTMALAIPTDRNLVSASVDPLNTSVQEIRFANGQSFTSYRLTFNHTKDDSNASALSIGELELLGTVGAGAPSVSIGVGAGGSLNITSTAPGTLESNTNLVGGTWISEGPISGTVNIIPDPAQRTKFYRVVVP